jgi:hypothetical protein
MRKKPTLQVELIGGPRCGAFAGVLTDQQELTLDEKDATTNLKTGKHLVYKRRDAKRFTFDRSYKDGHIVELVDGPLKKCKISVNLTDACLVLRTMSEGLAAYAEKNGNWVFLAEFPKGQDVEAEKFAREFMTELKKGGQP